ncbi:ferrous iron transport protein B [Bacteroidota bacterium]
MEFILVGQPYSGKSTIFNEVIGYKAFTSNFPGANVKYTTGKVIIDNVTIDVVDIPGTYSLQGSDEVESLTADYLMNKTGDHVIINVIDASVLSRSLEFTLQLMELQKPMVIALNMVDEAERKGIEIDVEYLSEILGVPIVKTIGKKGRGVYELFNKAYFAGNTNITPRILEYPKSTEILLSSLDKIISEKNIEGRWSKRFIGIKLIEKDTNLNSYLSKYFDKGDWEKVEKEISEFEKSCCAESEFNISSVRHSLAFEIFERVATVSQIGKKDIRYKVDDVLMHPIWGYVIMIGILYFIFSAISIIGNFAEPIFLDNFQKLSDYIASQFGEYSVIHSIVNGFVTGFGGGIGIVIPYLVPFFIFLSFLEDSGYLARIAYLIDNLMHHMGLHGLSVVPMILGYGCTVPGILATRILKSQRDKFITSALTTLIPCSARMTIIFGIVGFFISMKAAVAIYVINLVIIGITGKIMSKAMPEVSPGMILEIPKYHLPGIKVILKKSWFRLKEFVVIAWPLLIVGSIVLEVIHFYDLSSIVNNLLAPFTRDILGLPVAVGVTLLFGIMRKELALILLFSAMGTNNLIDVMTETQLFNFTIFVTFYIPCLATFAALGKELSWNKAFLITGLTTFVAIILVLLVRLFMFIF